MQAARLVAGKWWGDILVGALIGVACGIKINAVLIAAGLAWPLLMRREWQRTARTAVVALAVVVAEYSYYGLSAVKPLYNGSKWVTLPSPWWLLWEGGQAGDKTVQHVVTLIISCLWPVAMLIVAWLVYRRISSDQPREIVAPFALVYAWILVAPWVFPWYTAIAWVALTQVPRNRMTRWLTLVTVLLALWHSSGGQTPHPAAVHLG